MWHYALSPQPECEPDAEAIMAVVGRFLEESGVRWLEARQPYVFSETDVEGDIYDGRRIIPGKALPIIRAIVEGDTRLPWCKFESEYDTYLNFGLDDEVYFGSLAKCSATESLAVWSGLHLRINDRPSPYLESPGDSVDPPTGDQVWQHLNDRLSSEQLLVLERWAGGKGGTRAHLLRDADDLGEMITTLKPRCAVAVFPARDLLPALELAQSLPALEASYQGADGTGADFRIITAVPCTKVLACRRVGDFEEVRAVAVAPDALTWVLPSPQDLNRWVPPSVETYIRPDLDGVVRSRLAFHVDISGRSRLG